MGVIPRNYAKLLGEMGSWSQPKLTESPENGESHHGSGGRGLTAREEVAQVLLVPHHVRV